MHKLGKLLKNSEIFKILMAGALMALVMFLISIFWGPWSIIIKYNRYPFAIGAARYVDSSFRQILCKKTENLSRKEIVLWMQDDSKQISTNIRDKKSIAICLIEEGIKHIPAEKSPVLVAWIQQPAYSPDNVVFIFMKDNRGYWWSFQNDMRAWYTSCIVQQINPYVEPDLFLNPR